MVAHGVDHPDPSNLFASFRGPGADNGPMHAPMERPIPWAVHPASRAVRAAAAVCGVLLAAFLILMVGRPGSSWTARSTEPLVYSLMGVAVGASVVWAALRPTRRSLVIADLALILIPVAGIVL